MLYKAEAKAPGQSLGPHQPAAICQLRLCRRRVLAPNHGFRHREGKTRAVLRLRVLVPGACEAHQLQARGTRAVQRGDVRACGRQRPLE